MKLHPIFLTWLLSLFAFSAEAQRYIGLQIDNNCFTARSDFFLNGIPVVTLSAAQKFTRHIYLGARLSYRYRSFDFDRREGGLGANTTYYYSVRAGYIYLAAVADLALGKKDQIHFSVMPALGFKLGGKSSERIDDYASGQFGHYSTQVIEPSVSPVDARIGGQFWHCIPLSEKIAIKQDYYIAFGLNDLVRNIASRPFDFSIGVGIVYKLD